MTKPNKALKFVRMDGGLTQEELADALGVSAITIYRWERGDTSPSPYFRRRLCKLFQVSEQALGFQEQEEGEIRSREISSFLVDPCFPVSQVTPLGQQALLKEIERSPHRMIGLIGLPGSGKTFIAQALVGWPDVRQQVEGVLWAAVGQEARPLRHLQRWLMLLGEERVPANVEEVQDRLRVTLRGRKMLIVLDDLWKAEDIIPYQLGSQCRYLVTTRLPVVANSLCDMAYHPRLLTESQAFHLLGKSLPSVLVREHREVLRALCQQVGNLPLAVEQIGKYLRREARASSRRRFQDALTQLFQPASYLHLQIAPDSCSLAVSIKQSEALLSSSAQQAFSMLATHFPAAPAMFSERQVVDLFQTSRQLRLRDLDQLVDVGLVSASAKNRYQMHPVIAAYGRSLAEKRQGTAE